MGFPDLGGEKGQNEKGWSVRPTTFTGSITEGRIGVHKPRTFLMRMSSRARAGAYTGHVRALSDVIGQFIGVVHPTDRSLIEFYVCLSDVNLVGEKVELIGVVHMSSDEVARMLDLAAMSLALPPSN